MLADYAILIQERSGKAAFEELFEGSSKIPVEYRSAQVFQQYASAKFGWHRINGAYTFYVASLSGGPRIVFVCALKKSQELTEIGRARTRAAEALIAGVKKLHQSSSANGNAIFQHLSHDLRRIGASQAAAASEAKRFMEMIPPNVDESVARVNNMTELQRLLSLRLEMADDVFLREDLSDYVEIRKNKRIFAEFTKIQMAFMPLAIEKGILFQHVGSSYGLSLVPEFFAIVPFAIIDNAVKYAPRNSRIYLEFIEENSTISVNVRSKGPSISPDELSRLFQRGFRTRSAVHSSTQGSGLGLFIVRRIIEELCAGEVSASCVGENAADADIGFTVTVPKL